MNLSIDNIAPKVVAVWAGRVALALLATFILGWLLRRIGVQIARTTDYIDSRLEELEGGVAVHKVQIFSRLALLRIARLLLGVARWLAILTCIYLWLLACAFALDKSHRVADAILGPLLLGLARIGQAAVGFLPNLLFLLAILLAARLAMHIVTIFARAIEQGRVEFPWLPRDLAMPSRRLISIAIWLIALVVAIPYLPGSDSRAFQGVSIVLGVLLSLGSTSVTANLLAGLVLTYSRSYREGDRVKIGDVVGDITALGAFMTRVRTIKDQEVIIPNAVVQNGTILNYSRYAKETGVQVYTQVTIGYHTPWRDVHRLLITAAKHVEGILVVPEPYVLQRALDDFYVRYELCAFSNVPNELHLVEGRLNQSIQDLFAREGVEICSPHYRQLRDGNPPALPPDSRDVPIEPQTQPVLRPLPKPKPERAAGARSSRLGLDNLGMTPAIGMPPIKPKR